MKVAHLVPTLHPGGLETGLVDLAAAAPQAGLELMVVALATASDTTQVSALRRLGVPVAELGLAPYDPRAAWRVARALRERGAQIAPSRSRRPSASGTAASRAQAATSSCCPAASSTPARTTRPSASGSAGRWRSAPTDPRAVSITGMSDALWARVLGPAAVLAGRHYAVDVDAVLQVHDPDSYADGRFRLRGGPDGAECMRTDVTP